MLTWTKEQARDFFVNYQMINTSNNNSIREVFNRIKTIQMDPLNVVGTNPELVLQARIKNFKKIDLQNALYKDRILIDGWEKQMSIYETKFFPHFTRVRNDRSMRHISGVLNHYKFDLNGLIDDVHEIIKIQGPIFSSKIQLGDKKSNRWGSSKASTLAVDYLFHEGSIGVNKRNNTQKEYDLIENLIPNHNEVDPFSEEDEFILWYLKRRMETVGLVYSKSKVHFDGLHIRNRTVRNKFLEILLDNNFIEKVHVEGIKDVFYIPVCALDVELLLKNTISFIAPLDNLTWDREILKQLFDFDYIWEVYTPVKKRKYGYYVLPILRGSEFIGRIEFEKQRGNEPLRIKSLVYEEGIKKTKKLDNEINIALNKFVKYLGTNEVVL